MAFVALAALLVYSFWPERTITNFPSSNTGPIIFFGDSLVAGVGASAGKSLPEQLGVSLGEPVLNYGVAGDTTREGLRRIGPALKEKSRLVIILLGGNDFLRKLDRSETEANLKQMVLAFQQAGSVVLLLGVRSGIIGGGADELFESVAEATGAAYEEDVLKGVFGHSDLMSDTIHPNDAGYAQIVARLTPTIKGLLAR